MRFCLLFALLAVASVRASDYPGAPASVVAGYIEQDGAGLALDRKTGSQVLRYTTWKDALGGNSFLVIKSYDIGAVGWKSEGAKDGDTAYVQITYHVLGRLRGLEFTAEAEKEDVFFDVVRRKGQWKIVRPQLAPHLFVAAAITALETAGAKDNALGKTSLQKLRALE